MEWGKAMHRPVSVGSVALLVMVMIYIPGHTPNFTAPIPGGDYREFYLAARLYRDGFADRLYDLPFQVWYQHDPKAMPFIPDEGVTALYVYPPFFVWYCLPFSYLSYKAGAVAWMWCMAAALVAALWILPGTGADNKLSNYIPLFSIFYTPALHSLYSCQNATLSLLILSATYALLRVNRPTLAGGFFSLLAYKPQLTPVIAGVMLLKGQWRFVAGAMMGGLALLVASVAISPASTANYLRLAPTLSRWIDMPGMPLDQMDCWQGFWRLMLDGSPLRLVQAIAMVCSLATLGILAQLFRGPLEPTSGHFGRQFAALVLTSILVSPHLLHYDATLLLLPMVLTIDQPGCVTGSWLRLTVLVYATAVISPLIASKTHVNLLVPMMLAYLMALALRARPR